MSKSERYVSLDGLRSVAALAVVWLHTCNILGLAHPPKNAHLAVDFFFVLSGFVIAHAYEDRLRSSLSPMGFMRDRLIRIMPLAMAGAVFGGTALAIGTDISRSAIAAATALNGLLLPVLRPAGMHADAFPANGPLWSLFWEMAVNVLYAQMGPKLKTARLAMIASIGAALVVFISIGYHRLNVGWSSDNFYLGAVRVFYPFFCGVLISRIPVRQNRSGLAMMLVLFAILFGGKIGPIAETLTVLLAFPAITWIAAGSRLEGPSAAVCLWLGAASYPIYVLHQPIIRLWKFFGSSLGLEGYATAAAAVFTAVAAAWLATPLDRQFRNWLKRVIPAPIPAPAYSPTR